MNAAREWTAFALFCLAFALCIPGMLVLALAQAVDERHEWL